MQAQLCGTGSLTSSRGVETMCAWRAGVSKVTVTNDLTRKRYFAFATDRKSCTRAGPCLVRFL